MLYRLQPPGVVTWSKEGADVLALAARHNGNLDGLVWGSTESREFSTGLLALALRYGMASGSGLVVNAVHLTNLGRGDELRVLQQAGDEGQADVRASSGDLLESQLPGWTGHNQSLNDDVRAVSAAAAEKGDAELARDLAEPIKPDLAAHWISLGGTVPA